MKYLLITLPAVLLAVAGNVSARPFTTGCKWSFCYWNEHYENTYDFTLFELDEPYELNGKTYYKLYETRILHTGSRIERKPLIGLREESGRVFADYEEYKYENEKNGFYFYEFGFPYLITDENEVVLYDFNLNSEDILGATNNEVIVFVGDKRTIKLENGEERIIFNLKYREFLSSDKPNEGAFGNVISGIGAQHEDICDLIHYMYITAETIFCKKENFLNAYVEDGRLVYKAPDYTGNPAEEHLSHTTYKDDPFLGSFVTGIKSVTAEDKKADSNVFHDLSGRKMTGTLKPGIYIHNGKKMIVK